MKTYGIIAEYNPFHNGHQYHIEETRRRTGCDAVIALMSGNFVQRGEPALLDKWTRAEAAVRGGADLVLELPAVFACAGAELFAAGAVGILEGLGVVDGISFGTETESEENLLRLAEVTAREPAEYREGLQQYLSQGLPFAAARAKALEEFLGADAADLIRQPNNILAVEYLKQLLRRGSGLKPVAVRRKDAGYREGSLKAGMAGAGWIRERLREGQTWEDCSALFPEEAQSLYEGREPVFSDKMFPLLLYRLLTASEEDLASCDGVLEGLEHRARRAAQEAGGYEAFLTAVKSKRYSRTTVQRMMVRLLLQIRKEDMKRFLREDRYTVRILGFSERGKELLRQQKKEDSDRVFLVTNPARQRTEDPLLARMRFYDERAAALYDLIRGGDLGSLSEFRRRPFDGSHR